MEFIAVLSARGFPLSELDNWNKGALIDWCMEYDRILALRRGEQVDDPYEQYQTLKAMQPEIEQMHACGQIKEAKYKSYCAALERAEAALKE